MLALALNLIVSVVLTLVLRAAGVDAGTDRTKPSDYTADLGDEGVEEELDPEGATH
jgi:solute:Na+ symporter, SSS family